MLVSLATALSLLAPQASGWEQAPVGLTVVCVDVGQGDATVIRAPDGTVHVIDAGPSGQGTSAVAPVVNALSPTGYGVTVVSHYDFDHVGGMDEVLQAFPFHTAYDRGDENRLASTFVDDYLKVAAGRRATAVEGQVLQLGGGATLTVMAVNGRVAGGTVVPVSGTVREENARSVAMRLQYVNFAMWIGGDLSGGGGGTADVETAATAASGNVDVYQVDHHGSTNSTNQALVDQLSPELAIFSAEDNIRGSPAPATIARLSPSNAAIVLMGTTIGEGAVGFAVTGNVTIETDGARYRATAGNGQFLDFSVDEIGGRAPIPGDFRISEIHRDPAVVPDANGEYLEITNVREVPVSLGGVIVSTQSGAFTIASPLMLVPGRPVVMQSDGAATRNNGLPLGFVWPVGSIGLANIADIVSLSRGPVTFDAVVYKSGFAGGAGVAAERLDLLGPSAVGNFAPATAIYSEGERGTPGQRNSVDISAFAADLGVVVDGPAIHFHAAALSHGGFPSLVAMSLGTTPGFSLLGTHIPLNLDPLLFVTLEMPRFVGQLPAEGYRSFKLKTPVAFSGTPTYAAHIVVDIGTGTFPTVSPSRMFLLP